eukprot:7104514-Prymnesium_polylepis.1
MRGRGRRAALGAAEMASAVAPRGRLPKSPRAGALAETGRRPFLEKIDLARQLPCADVWGVRA